MQTRYSQTGFTVLELMIAFLLLAFGITGVGILLRSSLKSDQASQYSRGVNLTAADVVEDIKGRAVSNTATEFKNLQSAGQNVTTAGEMAGPTDLWYRYRWQVTDHTTGLLQLDVTVGWDNCVPADPDPDKCKHRSRFTNFIRPDGS